MIKAPFKRKSMPPSTVTVTPEKTPRAKRASSATRSLKSLSASSVNSFSEENIPVASDDFRVPSSRVTNPIVVIIDGEEVHIRDRSSLHASASVTTTAAATNQNNNATIEVDDSEAFPEEEEDELMNNSKNNLLTISASDGLDCTGGEGGGGIGASPPEDNKSVSDDDHDANGDADQEEQQEEKAKSEDPVTRSVKVARLKKKLRTKVLGLSNQLKETQQLSTENGNEMANKMMKYFSKVDTMENDKLISDDACSSKMNSPVHQASTPKSPITSPSGAKRKKSKKSRLRIKSPINSGEKSRSKDDNLIVGEETGNKSIRNVLFSSFRNYTKSSVSSEDPGGASQVVIKKEDELENDYLQPIQVKQKPPKSKSTMKKNIKSKFKRFNIGNSVDKLKTCKICEKKCRKVHHSRTVLDFKKEFKTDEPFDSEFCTCINSISIKNFNDEYFEEIDEDDEEDINIKNHLYSEIDGVSTCNDHCTEKAHTGEKMEQELFYFLLLRSSFQRRHF